MLEENRDLVGPDDKYLTDQYVTDNPTWDLEDSPWKANQVSGILTANRVPPKSICEVGCGAGYILSELRSRFPDADLFGFDIAPAASRFWPEHESHRIQFVVGDFLTLNARRYDVILLLDVIEHVRDPVSFLSAMRHWGKQFVLHIPLDLSAITVMREEPILKVRRKVGHIHYFTKNLALSLLDEAGYNVIDWKYTGAGFTAPRSSWRTKLARTPRWLARRLNEDWAVRTLGGETLLLLAEPKDIATR
jgi:cyclopropane fatty-acyl-phospholipid synthase-like methyltransferase